MVLQEKFNTEGKLYSHSSHTFKEEIDISFYAQNKCVFHVIQDFYAMKLLAALIHNFKEIQQNQK